MDDEPESLSEEERRHRAKLEGQRRWRAANRDRVAAYNRAYRTKDPDKRRRQRREEERRKRVRERARKARNAGNRRRYAENIDHARALNRDAQRRYIERKKAADPEAYRVKKNADARAWRAANRDAINARKRAKYRDDPEPIRARSRSYFERNHDAMLQRRRARYRADPEAVLSTNREYKRRERHRIANKLPPRRLHKVTAAERRANDAAADAFFSRPVTPELRERVLADDWTPPDLIFWFRRESDRIRALDAAIRDPELHERLTQERAARKAERAAREAKAAAVQAEAAAEEARLDAIAHHINNQLRTQPRQHRVGPTDPPHPPRPGAEDTYRGL